ncbi:hypothetical protein [Limnoglobus roseus]|uniref:Prenyltransferase n=1 Tax=Limnoglobus roseus TaxID=2598579 RepID=A0A5C1ATS4_9BACT|nr:hypothetical protein [Limnoglobus roseus]QEL20168.1 hypothetical protein PX52LOC_07256 [Limnoglobus roseus]
MNRDRLPWWLVPNVLAFDAPMVAVVWQRFLAAQFCIPVPILASTVLALVVWAVYLFDRWGDAQHGSTATERHRLAAAYPRTFLGLALVALVVAAIGCAFLPPKILWAGACVAACVGGYLGLVHLPASNWLADAGLKELLVGVGFAAGVSVPLVADGLIAGALPAVAAFGCLCWLNCRLIDRWESRGRVGPAELFLAAATASVTLATPPRVAAAINSAILLLVVVHVSCRHRLQAARVLADAVLLTPLAIWG